MSIESEPLARSPEGALALTESIGVVGGLYRRLRRAIRELGKFGIVGGISYAADAGIFAWMQHAHANVYAANAVSTVVSATMAFVGNRWWTWRDRDRRGLHREYGLYFVLNLIGLAITYLCLWASRDVLGAVWPVLTTPTAVFLSAKVFGVGLATMFRFWGYRRFVFAKPPTGRHHRR